MTSTLTVMKVVVAKEKGVIVGVGPVPQSTSLRALL